MLEIKSRHLTWGGPYIQNFEKGHFFPQDSKFFFVFHGDESPYDHKSKSMIGFVPSALKLELLYHIITLSKWIII